MKWLFSTAGTSQLSTPEQVAPGFVGWQLIESKVFLVQLEMQRQNGAQFKHRYGQEWGFRRPVWSFREEFLSIAFNYYFMSKQDKQESEEWSYLPNCQSENLNNSFINLNYYWGQSFSQNGFLSKQHLNQIKHMLISCAGNCNNFI